MKPIPLMSEEINKLLDALEAADQLIRILSEPRSGVQKIFVAKKNYEKALLILAGEK